MIRSYADKMKIKQDAYAAEQEILAEQAEQTRIRNDKLLFLEELEEEKSRANQILAEEAHRKEQKYLREKDAQDAITRRRIEEWAAAEEGRLAEIDLNKKIIKQSKIRSALRDAAKKTKPLPKKKRSVNEGMPMNASATWQLTWKSFSMHPDVIDLPMSEKMRLYKLAEQQQPDRTNYYTNLFSADNSMGNGGDQRYWADGIVDVNDNLPQDDVGVTIIEQSVTWTNSVDVNLPITVYPGVILTVLGILTVNAAITNFGTIIVRGAVLGGDSIYNVASGQLIVE